MVKTILFSITLFTLITTAVAAVTTAQVGERAPNFDLKDQFGKQWTLNGLSGTPTVLIVANQDSGKVMGPWVDALKAKYPNKVQILGLLDLHTVPSIGRGIAKSRIRSETKDPLMLDFNSRTAKSYGVSEKHPVVVVIDKASIVRAIQSGPYSQESFDKITAVVSKML